MSNSETIKTHLCIIGAGLAGLAATLFAANRGLSCVEVGQTGEINFSSGFLDLLGVHPVEEKHAWTDPWAGIDALVRGGTAHFDLLAAEVAKGVAQAAISSGVPMTFGVITADTLEQAVERAGTKMGNKGWEAALAAIEMARLAEKLDRRK